MNAPWPDRRAQFELLASQPPDLLVIGGGIVGAGIAWEARLRGLSVAVLEKHDFASGTSSKSSKLLHGGLRYLENLELPLVFESLAQRNRLFQDAPHVARPLPFLFPTFRGGPDRGWVIGLGLFVYDMLATLSNKRPIWHQRLSADAAKQEEPGLRREKLLGAHRYTDGLTEDARLVIETLKSAVELGAIALNHVAVEGFLKDENGRITGVQARDRLADRPLEVRAKVVFNAAGPWADALCKLDDPGARRRLRPTKGVHILTRAFVADHAVVLRSPLNDGRILFVIPWQGRTLIGTTDTDHHGDPDDTSYLDTDVEASPDEVRYLLDTVNASFDVTLKPADVLSAFAGWRPLIAPPEAGVAESKISREQEIFGSQSGLITIAGGKLTAYRTMARQAVEAVVEALQTPAGPSAIEHAVLTGSDLAPDHLAAARAGAPDLPAALVEALAARHGSHWPALQALLAERPELAAQLGDQPHYAVEAVYAVRYEAAETLADFLARRTRLFLIDADQGLGCAAPVAELMARELQQRHGWSEPEREAWTRRELAAYRAMVEHTRGMRVKG